MLGVPAGLRRLADVCGLFDRGNQAAHVEQQVGNLGTRHDVALVHLAERLVDHVQEVFDAVVEGWGHGASLTVKGASIKPVPEFPRRIGSPSEPRDRLFLPVSAPGVRTIRP